MKRAQAFLMSREDLADVGRLLVAERPSVRFRSDAGRDGLRAMPLDTTLVHVADAELAPGYDLAEPDLWLGDDGVGIQIVTSRLIGDEMRTGSMSTVFNDADAGHRTFVDATFRALRLGTKPHVEDMMGRPARVRIGPEAERWWREKEGRTLRHASVGSILYRVRTPKR
jgi:hypothetical protein